MRTAAALLTTLALALVASEAAGQDRPAGWTAWWENDSFAFFGGSDRNYTNGVRLAWGAERASRDTFRGRMEEWWRLFTPLLRGTFQYTSSQWVAGQSFFTPSVITDYDPIPRDRPFAAIAYGGLRIDAVDDAADLILGRVTRRDRTRYTRQHSLEVDVGILGAAAGAETFQTFAHILRENRIPKGWRHQLPHEPFVAVSSMARVRMGRHYLDLTPHGGMMLGTAQTYPYAGATLRLGWNMTDFPSLLVRPTAVPTVGRPEWEVALLTGVEGRWMLHNGFVEGGLRTDSDGPDAARWVGDWRLGVSLRLTDWRVSWTRVRRSPELADVSLDARRYHDYGSLTLAYEPGRSTSDDREGTFMGCLVDGVLAPVLDGLLLEAGTGPADAAGADAALGSRVAVGRRFAGGAFAVGGEVMGIGREFGPPPVPGAGHEDLFLVNRVVTLRAVPFGRLGPGRLHFRGGVGSGLAKHQVTPDEPGERTGPCPPGFALDSDARRYCNRTERGTGWLLGAGYWLPLETDRASLGLDYAWNRVSLDDPVQFAALTLGFQWHP